MGGQGRKVIELEWQVDCSYVLPGLGCQETTTRAGTVVFRAFGVENAASAPCWVDRPERRCRLGNCFPVPVAATQDHVETALRSEHVRYLLHGRPVRDMANWASLTWVNTWATEFSS